MPDRATDAIVIGAGIIGASIAWRLAQRGVDVVLLDAGTVGGEASTAGAGMLAPGGEYERHSRWAELAIESRRQYPAFVDELREESGLDIHFRECGAIDLAYGAADWTELQTRARAQAELGIRVEQLPVEDVEHASKDGLVAALHYPDDAVVDPHDIMGALRKACKEKHVLIREYSPVSGIEQNGTGLNVILENVKIGASLVVVAAGAWSSSLEVSLGGRPAPLPESLPVKGHLLGYDRPPGSLPVILRHGDYYVLERSRGFTIGGTSSERVGFNRKVDQRLTREIQTAIGRFLPALISEKPADSWAGFRPATANMEPAVHRHEDSNLWLAYGHYRNGILLAPATSRLLADEITSS